MIMSQKAPLVTMTDDSKEWVTIKVPSDVRDDARDDPRTYGQVMRAGLENEPFADGDVGDLRPFGGEVPDLSGELEATKEDINELKDMIDSLAFDGGVLDGEAEEIMGRLDDLEARLPRKVAEELEGQR